MIKSTCFIEKYLFFSINKQSYCYPAVDFVSAEMWPDERNASQGNDAKNFTIVFSQPILSKLDSNKKILIHGQKFMPASKSGRAQF